MLHAVQGYTGCLGLLLVNFMYSRYKYINLTIIFTKPLLVGYRSVFYSDYFVHAQQIDYRSFREGIKTR